VGEVTTTHQPEVPQRAGRREWGALASLVLVVLLLAIDGTVLYLAVPALTHHLDPSAAELLWIGDIYGFVLAGLLITMGNLADRIGRKKLLLIGAGAFGCASALAAIAPNPELLIAARAVLGLAAATLMPSSLSIVRAMFSDRAQRTRAIAIWSAGATAGAALGPVVGGALLEKFWWGSVFLINVPIMALVLVLGSILLPESRGNAEHPVDVVSSALSILAIVPLVYALKHWVGTGFDVAVPVSGAIGLLAGWLFIRRQKRLPYPLLDVTLFRSPAFTGAVASNGVALFAFMGVLFFFSQYLQLVRGFGPLTAGLAELPATFASIVVISIVGVLVAKLGTGRAIGAGLFFAALGLVGIALSAALPAYWGLAIALAVLGLGVGVAATLSVDAVVTVVPKERAGAASSISETAYELGGALGIAALGSIHLATYRSHLDRPPGTDPADIAHAQRSLTSALAEVHQPELIAHAQQAFTTAMQTTAYLAAASMAAAAVVAWTVIPSRRAAKMSSHEAR
jgi:DHA2 family multidrug resistance protein-like MFS transporter